MFDIGVRTTTLGATFSFFLCANLEKFNLMDLRWMIGGIFLFGEGMMFFRLSTILCAKIKITLPLYC